MLALVALGAAVVAGWWWTGAPLRVRVLDPVEDVPEMTPVGDGLLSESLELELLFDDAVLEGAAPDAGQLGWLEDAVAAEREFVGLTGAEGERLAALERKLGEARARHFGAPLDAREALAEALAAAGDTAGASTELRAGLAELDFAIGRGAVFPGRRERMSARLEDILATAAGAELARLEGEARQARREGRRAEADGLLAEALLVQRRINFEFSRSSFAGLERLAELERLRAEWTAEAAPAPGR